LIFVSSRRQTRLTALELIAFLATEEDPKQWLNMDEREVTKHVLFSISCDVTLLFIVS
jgi:activating signal cointegrator complex subunit 3